MYQPFPKVGDWGYENGSNCQPVCDKNQMVHPLVKNFLEKNIHYRKRKINCYHYYKRFPFITSTLHFSNAILAQLLMGQGEAFPSLDVNLSEKLIVAMPQRANWGFI